MDEAERSFISCFFGDLNLIKIVNWFIFNIKKIVLGAFHNRVSCNKKTTWIVRGLQVHARNSRRVSSESRLTRVFRLPIHMPRENSNARGAAA